MARPKGNSNKREKEKQRQKEKREKREKMEERKANVEKGKSLEDMMAYVDEDGNLTSSPPDPEKRKVINAEDIEIGVPKMQEQDDAPLEGKVDYFDAAKGFGFIMQITGMKVFFHISEVNFPVNEGDLVTFMVEKGPKGLKAVGVEKKK